MKSWPIIGLSLALLLVAVEGSAPRRVYLRILSNPSREKLDQARTELEAGANFWEVARRYSNHPTASRGGYLGEVWLDQVSDEFRKLIESLPPGGLSPVVLLDGDYTFVRRLEKEFPRNAYRVQVKGEELAKAGKYQEAIKLYDQAIEIFPDFIHAYFLRGVAYGRLGQYDKEIESYQSAVKIEPRYELGHYNLGLAFIKVGNLDAAVQALRNAVSIKSDYTDAWASLAGAYLNLGDLQAAEKAAREAIAANPLRPEGHYNLGAVRSRVNPVEARQYFETAVNLDGGRPEFQLALALTKGQSGDLAGAVDLLKRMRKEFPDFKPAADLLSQIESASGKPQGEF